MALSTDEIVQLPWAGLQIGPGTGTDALTLWQPKPSKNPARFRVIRRNPVNSLSLMSQGGGSFSLWNSGASSWAPAGGIGSGGLYDALLTAGGGITSYFSQKNAAKNQRKLLKLQIQARSLGIGGFGGQAPPLGGTAAPATFNPAGGYTTAAYLTGGDDSLGGSPLDSLFGGDATTEANMMGGLLPALATGARALATSPRVIALGRSLLRYLPTLGAAAAVELAANMVGDGVDAGDGPYANPRHNKCTGIMRGDVMALRRVKRQGKRLLKTLRMAGAVPRSGRFRSRARRR